MSINFNHLKTFCSALIQKMKSFRGNWNQNDPTADDYIKNRPFYSEKKEMVTLPDTTINVEEPYSELSGMFSIKLVDGQTYIVTYDGVEYTCVARSTYENEPFIGNSSIIGWNDNIDTGEPFFIDVWNNRGVTFAATTAGTHTIRIDCSSEIIHKLDKKFIDMPDGIVTEDSLENTLENNLAPVAFTNSYDSLDNKPGVVQYDTVQSLSDHYQRQARTNIGAGTSNFDGSYIDTFYKPCNIDTTRTEFAHWLARADSTGHSSNIRNKLIDTDNTKFPTVGSKYEISIRRYSRTTYRCTSEIYALRAIADKPTGYNNTAITLGNPYLFYAGCEDNGEPFCITFHSNGFIHYYIDTNAFGTEIESHDIVINEITEGIIHKLDRRLFPDDIAGAKNSIIFNDSVTGFEYVVQVQNGNLVSSLKCTGIEITTMPDKVEYTDGENFDPTGMVVVATYPDGSTKEIIDYTYYSDILTKDMNGIEISYTEAGFTYTNIAHISVNPFDAAKALIDFYYTDNKNGTYTITGWKQTLNGESSTELIVSSNPSIIV